MSASVLGAMMMSSRLALVLFIAAVGWATVCGWFADRRGRPVALWAVLGFFLGWIGFVILLVLPNCRKRPGT